jgi:hypothetical protein
MKSVTRPPIDANGVGHGGDDLDEALFAFFRSEMPHPWPQLKLPAGAPPAPPVRPAQPAPAPSRRPWFRSPRFALAASVALLIAGYALMSAALPAPSGDRTSVPNLKEGEANRKHNLLEQPKVGPGKDAAEEDLDFHERLEQDGNKGTIYIEIFKNK